MWVCLVVVDVGVNVDGCVYMSVFCVRVRVCGSCVYVHVCVFVCLCQFNASTGV